MSAGTAYTKRYGGGFINLPTTTTPIDASFLNAVEAALREIYAVAPSADAQVMQWDNANTRITPALILNKNIDPAAAIAYSKLQLATSIVNADIAAGAAIAYSKLSLNNQIQNADLAGSIAASKLLNYPTDIKKALRGDGTWGLMPTWTYSLVSAPPSSPQDGDIWVAVDSVTAPTYQWMFRYNTGEATNKWEFVGGNPLFQETTGAAAITSVSPTYADLSVNVTFTLPRSGDYIIGWGGQISTASAHVGTLALCINGSVAAADIISNTGIGIGSKSGKLKTGLTSTNVVKLQGGTDNAGFGVTFSNYYLSVVPARVA